MNIMDFIDYDDNHDDFSQELEMNHANSGYIERSEEVYVEDAPYDFGNPLFIDGYDPNMFNSLMRNETQQNPLNHQNGATKQWKPFKIIRPKKGDLSSTTDDSSLRNHSLPDPISSKSRRIMKRELAKQRNQSKQVDHYDDHEDLFHGISMQQIPEEFHSANMDEKSRKKMLQMIRNRISAQNSRDRRKHLIETLENQKQLLTEENIHLKQRVRYLEDLTSSLQKELNEYKKTGEKSSYAEVNHIESPRHEFIEDHILNPFELQSSNPSTEIQELSGNDSPMLRRSLRSGGFMKFSLALLTIFAVAMFSSLNSSGPMFDLSDQTFTKPRQLSEIQNEANTSAFSWSTSPTFEFDIAPKVINNPPGPVSSESDKLSSSASNLVETQTQVSTRYSSVASSLSVTLEANSFANHPYIFSDLEQYPFLSSVTNLQKDFEKLYINKFSSQLKVAEPSYYSLEGASIPLNSGSYLNVSDFAGHLKATKRTVIDFPDYRFLNSTSHIVTFDGSPRVPAAKDDNFSSLFCPTGYEFQGRFNDFSSKESETAKLESQKKLKLIDSEWLQLFVPRENISLANFVDSEEVMVRPSQSESGEESPIVEVWCKVFFIRELKSGFQPLR